MQLGSNQQTCPEQPQSSVALFLYPLYTVAEWRRFERDVRCEQMEQVGMETNSAPLPYSELSTPFVDKQCQRND